MMKLYTVIGVGIALLVSLCVVRELKKELTPVILLSGFVLIMLLSVGELGQVTDFVGELGENAGKGSFSVLLKALGISWLTYSASEICSSCGESALGKYIEAFGKLELLVLSIPYLNELFLMIRSV